MKTRAIIAPAVGQELPKGEQEALKRCRHLETLEMPLSPMLVEIEEVANEQEFRPTRVV